MAAAIMIRSVAHCGGLFGGGLRVLITGDTAMMSGYLRRRGRLARQHAEHPGNREDAQHGQHGDADGAQVPAHEFSIARHNAARLNRRALPITDTELKVMAALAMIGLSSSPKTG